MVAELNERVEGFILKDISVSCSSCHCSFATPCLLALPPVTEYDIVEADLHRVLPSSELRAALIAVCPHCQYASWTVRFKLSSLNPEMLPDAPQMAHSKKFALAVKFARQQPTEPLDLAFIALNGLYCAREAGEDSELWLELAAYEQSRGLEQEGLIAPTGQDYLVMAELWRQLGSFERAIEAYEKASEDEFIPRDLIAQQIALAQTGNTEPTVLAPYVVREIFPDVIVDVEPDARLAKNGRPVPPNIIRQPNEEKLGLLGPPERRTPLSSAVTDEPPRRIEERKDNVVAIDVSNAPPAAPAESAAVTNAAQAAGNDTHAPGIGAHATSIDAHAPANGAQAAGAQPAPAKDQPIMAPEAQPKQDTVPVEKVRQIIAQPQGASAIYLVQAAQVPQVDTAAPSQAAPKKQSKKRASKEQAPQQNPLPPMEAPTNEYFDGAASPSAPEQTPTGRAVDKAMKAKKDDPADKFPNIQLTDDYEDEYDYEDEDQQQAQQPVLQDEDSKPTVTDAIAQVESFLSLTRQTSYQNWIRSYRR